jgi:alpha-D-ribose 1-methylphosphonate 5-triphosphate synthase subunit PhnI
MGYTAVKGGADAIAAAERLVERIALAPDETAIEVRQVLSQLGPTVDKVMGEGGLYTPELAALAVKQCEGDLFEASFMIRAYRSTLPRFAYGRPVLGDEMRVWRRISSAFKDVPGGQLLGRTRDYTQRLLDLSMLDDPRPRVFAVPQLDEPGPGTLPKVSATMRALGLMEPLQLKGDEPFDITRESMRYPVSRAAWLQALARGESGAMVCLAYSAQRGYGGGGDHGTIGELRVGDLPVDVVHPFIGEPVTVGWIRATEVEMFGKGGDDPNGLGSVMSGETPKKLDAASYGMSYGLVFGQHERKAISMAMLDSSLQAGSDGGPASDQEMVLYHVDGIESYGFVEHLKLPHFVTFGSGLQLALERREPAGATKEE